MERLNTSWLSSPSGRVWEWDWLSSNYGGITSENFPLLTEVFDSQLLVCTIRLVSLDFSGWRSSRNAHQPFDAYSMIMIQKGWSTHYVTILLTVVTADLCELFITCLSQPRQNSLDANWLGIYNLRVVIRVQLLCQPDWSRRFFVFVVKNCTPYVVKTLRALRSL